MQLLRYGALRLEKHVPHDGADPAFGAGFLAQRQARRTTAGKGRQSAAKGDLADCTANGDADFSAPLAAQAYSMLTFSLLSQSPSSVSSSSSRRTRQASPSSISQRACALR